MSSRNVAGFAAISVLLFILSRGLAQAFCSENVALTMRQSSQREIHRLTGIDRKTNRFYAQSMVPLPADAGPSFQRPPGIHGARNGSASRPI